jgi:hypothetical protein
MPRAIERCGVARRRNLETGSDRPLGVARMARGGHVGQAGRGGMARDVKPAVPGIRNGLWRVGGAQRSGIETDAVIWCWVRTPIGVMMRNGATC